MPGLPVLDLVLGMVFLYLLLSLVCTAVVEWISGLRRRRAQVLAHGIRELLGDPSAASNGGATAEAFYAHPLIQSLTRTSTSGADALPSYVPARTFALALLDLLAPATVDEAIVQAAAVGDLASQQAARTAHAAQTAIARMHDVVDAVQKLPPESYLGRTLRVLIADARGDLAALQENLEVWYNHAMDRVSGWYKRWTQ